MVLAWGILAPVGALAARYGKILPGQGWPRRLDNPLWWHAHRGCQYAAVALTFVGLYLAWTAGADSTRSLHAVLGWGVALAGIAQVAGGLLRGSKGSTAEPAGDHYAMTRRRVRFERIHKSLGWGAVLLAAATIVLGLHLADAPRWMAAILLLWWAGLGAVAFVLQRRGWCADTYQAIWGPSPEHPGNRIPPIGWGIRRGEAIGAAYRSRRGTRR
ncbi:MAG: cytochrome b [Burkholderiales bacterium]|nr:cytochrome b [Burkholderiales bacterium]